MADDQREAVLGLLAAGGSTPRTLESWQQDRMTALLLAEGPAQTPAIAAIMPIARRTLHASPTGPALAAGWLSANQFATRMSLRRATRDSAGSWAELLSDIDALFVVRRDERSLAARWYAYTGFHDVLSIRCLYLDMAAQGLDVAPDVGRYHVHTVSPAELSGRWTGQMLAVHQETFRATGGSLTRSEAFWRPALEHHFYGDHYQFQVLGLWTGPLTESGASLMGYAIVGWSGWHSKRPRMDILELATRQWDTAAASALIHAACRLASSKNVHQVRAVISAQDPYRGYLARFGFVDRWGYLLLAKWLHPQRYLDALAATLPPALACALEFTAPTFPPVALRGPTVPGSAPQSVATDAATLTRLLLNRLDVPQAAQQGLLAANHQRALPDALLRHLSLAFPWTPWAFHMLDYI